MSRRLPHLSRAHAHVLALWSYGMVLAHSGGITSVVALLAPLVGASESTLRQRLREWCYDAQDKRGTHRQAVEVRACFAPLLGWVLAWWGSAERRLALVLDASTLSRLASRCWRSASSIAGVPSPLPGRWSARIPKGRGHRTGKPSWRTSRAVSPQELDSAGAGRSRLVCPLVV